MDETIFSGPAPAPATPGKGNTAIEISMRHRKLQVLAVKEALKAMGQVDPQTAKAKLQVGPPYLKSDHAGEMLENLLLAGEIIMDDKGRLVCQY